MTLRMKLDRISPLWLGIAISGSLIAILLITESVMGRWEDLLAGGDFDPLARVSGGILRDLRLAIVHCLLVGYLPAALLHVVQRGRRTVFVLQNALNCTREECERLAASVWLSRRGLLLIGALGIALALLTPYMVRPVPSAPWSPSSWSPEVAWHRLLGPVILLFTFWLGYAIVTVSVRMSRLAKKLNHIDLLDLSPLAPFTQQGLTNALLVIGLLSIFSLVLLEPGFGSTMLLIGGPSLLVAALALLYPVRGVHRRIHESKDAELGKINEAITARRSAFRNPEAGQQSGEMADLIAYRGLIESVPEWPFTSSTYFRFILYMLIPVASWGFGVIAEEVVSRTLF